MVKKTKNINSDNGSLNKKIVKSISDAKELLIKEREYEQYLKRIEKLSRGLYNA